MPAPLPLTPIAPGLAPTSPLFFGAASVGGRVDPKAAMRALSLAIELGVTGIDLARSYGYGHAERIVGEAIRGMRDRILLCTKAGIEPAPISPLMRRAAPVARALARHLGGLRGRLTRATVPAAQAQPFDPQQITRSLETSLAELGTDRVDILLSHRCPSTTGEYDEFAALAESFVARGMIRLWGICGSLADIERVSAHARPPVAQLPAADAFAIEREPATVLTMLYQPFGGADGFQRLLARAPVDLTPRQRRRWVTEVALRGPLSTASSVPRALVCAMSSPEHVEANVDALGHPRMSTSTLTKAYRDLHKSPAPP